MSELLGEGMTDTEGRAILNGDGGKGGGVIVQTNGIWTMMRISVAS